MVVMVLMGVIMNGIRMKRIGIMHKLRLFIVMLTMMKTKKKKATLIQPLLLRQHYQQIKYNTIYDGFHESQRVYRNVKILNHKYHNDYMILRTIQVERVKKYWRGIIKRLDIHF